MAMLDRYRKPGGFLQLLTLLETCGQVKKEKFLEIVHKEDHRWADALRTKILDVDRIYSWSDETLAEVVGTMQDLTVALSLHSVSEDVKVRIHGVLSHGRRRKIEELFEINKPTPQESAANNIKIIETVRRMANEGAIRFEKFDSNLAIPENIEEKLSKANLLDEIEITSVSIDPVSSAEPTATESSGSIDAKNHENNEARVVELATLKRKVAELAKENATLRHDLNVAKTKLDQIKKIA